MGLSAEKRVDIWKLTMTAMLSAVGFVLMFLEFSVPIMPSFIKLDLSELPALLGAFAMGPASGVMICLVKNLLHLFMTSTGGVGELSNFILGICFVLPAGLIYQRWKGKKKRHFRSRDWCRIDGVCQHSFQFLYRISFLL